MGWDLQNVNDFLFVTFRCLIENDLHDLGLDVLLHLLRPVPSKQRLASNIICKMLKDFFWWYLSFFSLPCTSKRIHSQSTILTCSAVGRITHHLHILTQRPTETISPERNRCSESRQYFLLRSSHLLNHQRPKHTLNRSGNLTFSFLITASSSKIVQSRSSSFSEYNLLRWMSSLTLMWFIP